MSLLTLLRHKGVGAGADPSKVSLEADAVAYWKLDEASGVRNDSKGTNHLTDNNTVTQAVGKVGNAAQLTKANVEFLSLADNADMSTGDISFTWAGWLYMDSKPAGICMVLSKEGTTAALTEYMIRWDNVADRLEAYIGGASYVGVVANSLGAPVLATWYFVKFWHDAAANTVNIQVNGGTVDSTATAGVAPSDTVTAFQLGGSAGQAGRTWDGRLDEWGFWKRTLTAAEDAYLYNGGAGRTLF